MSIPLIAGLGPQELIIIAVVLVLLFGAKKLPELARGSGQALRIFKAETKALHEDDDKTDPRAAGHRRAQRGAASTPTPRRTAARASAAPTPRLSLGRGLLDRRCLRPLPGEAAEPRRRRRPDGTCRPLPGAARPAAARVTVLIVAIIVALVFYDQIFEFVTCAVQRGALALDQKPRRQASISSDDRRPADAPAQAVHVRGDRRDLAVLAVADLGVHPARPEPTRAQVELDLHRVAGPLFLAGMALGFYVMPKGLAVLIGFTPAQRGEPGGVRRATSASSPGCCWSSGSRSRSRCSWSCSTSPASSRASAGALPPVDHPRHLRVRRGRDPVHRPVLDADAGRARCWCSSGSPRSSRG